jgi:hypothetical protein
MDRTEEVIVGLFTRLREDLREESSVGMALKAEGRNITLRIRSEKEPGDEKRPYFAVVIGLAVGEGAFRVSYKPSGVPLAGRQVTILDADSAGQLLGLVRGYIEVERCRLREFRQGL